MFAEYWNKIVEWIDATHIVEQVKDVDAHGLFTNPWFMVPFCAWVAWMIYKLKWKDLLIIAIIGGVWWVSGTAYMHSLIVGGVVQIEKILPVVFGGAVALAFVIYLLFGRSD